MVRLLVGRGTRPRAYKPCFNSKMVRLLGGTLPDGAFPFFRFNSKMVRLLATCLPLPTACHLRFNSKMVRLLARRGRRAKRRGYVSIPKWCDCWWVVGENVFGLVNVSIPKWCDCWYHYHLARMVVVMFQFQNGAIAGDDATLNERVTACFNSKMVRLLAARHDRRHGAFVVSIPKWCDCWPADRNGANPIIKVSIPKWCDCWCKRLLADNGTLFVSIPKWCDCWPCRLGGRGKGEEFQFQNGAIAGSCSRARLCPVSVSIPKWCDCWFWRVPWCD